MELDPERIELARASLKSERKVRLVQDDFLARGMKPFDYVVGNPPYVPIDALSDQERAAYRARFETARGRLDLYILFWERALGLLRPGGRLVFITPEKFCYVETARPLRKLLARYQVAEVHFAPEDTFPTLTTYPTITTIVARPPSGPTVVRARDGRRASARLPRDGSSWQPLINGAQRLNGKRSVADIALRVSCGVATGADRVFVIPDDRVPAELRRMSRPTLAGRELKNGASLPAPRRRMLLPYDQEGRLLPEEQLGALGDYLRRPEVKERLQARTCAKRKPWYAFHDSVVLPEILQPKLLCKDITSEPRFWVDREGSVLPQHSVYYVVPRSPEMLDQLAEYLNSEDARSWLRSHCQRAANGYLRLQSAVLKKLPVPDDLGRSSNFLTAG